MLQIEDARRGIMPRLRITGTSRYHNMGNTLKSLLGAVGYFQGGRDHASRDSTSFANWLVANEAASAAWERVYSEQEVIGRKLRCHSRWREHLTCGCRRTSQQLHTGGTFGQWLDSCAAMRAWEVLGECASQAEAAKGKVRGGMFTNVSRLPPACVTSPPEPHSLRPKYLIHVTLDEAKLDQQNLI